MFVRLLNKKQNLICLLIISISWLLFYLPIIQHINYAFFEWDWQLSYYFADTFRKIITEYHQFPLRTPFMAGGYPIIGHPYDISLSPFSVLILIFGAVKGSTIIALMLSFSGALGMFYLTKIVLKYNYLGALFSTLVFMLCKWGLNMISDGNYQKLYYWLLPWLVSFLIRSKNDKRFIFFSGFILYLIITQGGLVLIPVMLFLFLFACLQSIEIGWKRKIKIGVSYIIPFLLIIIFTLCLSAVKIIPMWQLNKMKAQFIHLPDEDSYSEISKLAIIKERALNWSMYRRALLEREFYNLPYAMYLGYVPLILCVWAFLAYPRQTWRYLFLLIVFMFIQMGSNAPLDIFKWVWYLHPVVHGIWALQKYFTIFVFFIISLIAGRFFLIFTKLPKQKSYIKLVGFSLILFCAVDMFKANTIYYTKEIIYEKIPKFKPQHDFFQIKLQDTAKYAKEDITQDLRYARPIWHLLLQNVGLVNFGLQGNIVINESAIPKYIVNTVKVLSKRVDEGEVLIPEYEIDKNIYKAIFEDKKYPLPPGYINPLYKGEVFFLNTRNNCNLQYFSPNKIIINVDLHFPDLLVINQNYHKSWKSEKGKITSYNGLLAVKIADKGNYSLKLNYIPFGVYIGLSITVITLITAVYLSIVLKK